MNTPQTDPLIDNLVESADFEQQPPSDVVAYTELRSCADLARLHDDNLLDINPEYQRDVVWTDVAQSRFIDSLIKQLPIPSMCFGLNYKSETWQVIDGLQRISSIVRFLTRDDWRISKLDDINPNISGKTVGEIRNSADKNIAKLYARVRNATIPITIIRCDPTKNEHQRYLFTIFHRLNSGGVKLNNQEIRNCIFNGSFNKMLKDLNANEVWTNAPVFRGPGGKNRFVRMEIILRHIAFRNAKADYNGSMARFLNDYMQTNRNAAQEWIDFESSRFSRVMAVIGLCEQVISDLRFNSTDFGALMHGIDRHIDLAESLPPDTIRSRITTLKGKLSDPSAMFDVASTAKVLHRLDLAAEVICGSPQ